MNKNRDVSQLHINFGLENYFHTVRRKLKRKYGSSELNGCMNQILSLIGYKYLSQNIETNDGDIGYTLNENYRYNNLLINKGTVIETLKIGIEEITQNNDNMQAADVFYDIFNLMDFEKYSCNEDWLFFIELVEKLDNETEATLGQIFNFITQYPETSNSIYHLKPAEILAKVLTKSHEEIEDLYDPYATNGSLLVAIGNEINVKNYYGQHTEFDKYVLAKLNLLVNNINYKNIFVKNNDITNPNAWEGKKFDLCASIPDFGKKGINILSDDKRFKPFSSKKLSEFAYILDMIYNLDDDGSIGVIVPYGLLFRRGVEHKIIKQLVDNQLISTILRLPENLFDKTSIPTALIILNKTPKEGIFYLDLMYTPKDRQGLSDSIKLSKFDEYVSILDEHKEIEFLSKTATIDDVIKNDYNLSINRYVDLENVHEVNIIQTMDNIRIMKDELKKLDGNLDLRLKKLLK